VFSQFHCWASSMLERGAVPYLEGLLTCVAVDLSWHGRVALSIWVPASSRPWGQRGAWPTPAACTCGHARGRHLSLPRVRAAAAASAAGCLRCLLLLVLVLVLLLLRV
jgi:hypothetical protein